MTDRSLNFRGDDALPSGTRPRVEAVLSRIEAKHDVKILFAVESGSRAWGFPSPDSDFDVRFVYAHRADWYLSVRPKPDVIELPIEGDLDVGGWDLRKALGLLLKPNAVLLEWLSSPLRYRWDEAACAPLRAFARRVSHRKACRYHYLHLGKGQQAKHLRDRGTVNRKKYFYVLRPALALRWLRLYPDPPPMNLQALLAGLDLDAPTLGEVAVLLERKRRAKEMGAGPRVGAIDRLIADEFASAEAALAEAGDPGRDKEVLWTEADALFRSILRGAERG